MVSGHEKWSGSDNLVLRSGYALGGKKSFLLQRLCTGSGEDVIQNSDLGSIHLSFKLKKGFPDDPTKTGDMPKGEQKAFPEGMQSLT